MPRQNSVSRKSSFMHSRMEPFLCYSHIFSPNVFGNDRCPSSFRECHLPMFFRVNNLDVMFVRSRFRRILLEHKNVLYDYYVNQRRRNEQYYGPFRKTIEDAFLHHAF